MAGKHYPLKFIPILKDRIWGGSKLAMLSKEVKSNSTGESWELSAVPGDLSIVANGTFKGKSISEIIADDPEGILGSKVFSKFKTEFPLLFKFLDAREDLSIQVHPNDELAMKRHGTLGKAEMWYILEAEENSRIIVGFKKQSSASEYFHSLEEKALPAILKEYKVQRGDVFFLQTGTVHAIGGGIVLAEIQQSSDVTYRVYDWDRTDSEGNQRELHVEQALEAINYGYVDPVVQYEKSKNRLVELVKDQYFTTSLLDLDREFVLESNEESFKVLMCIKGSGKIFFKDGETDFGLGDTILLPAKLGLTKLAGFAELLEIHI